MNLFVDPADASSSSTLRDVNTFESRRLATFLTNVFEPVPPKSNLWQQAYVRRMLGRILALILIGVLPYSMATSDNASTSSKGTEKFNTRAAHVETSLSNIAFGANWIPTPAHLSWLNAARLPALRILTRMENRFGGSAESYRLQGLILHLINIVLLWFLLRRLEVKAGWLIAAVFALHPGTVIAVAWSGQHGRLWGALFCLIEMLSLCRTLRISTSRQLYRAATADAAWEYEYQSRVQRLLMYVSAIANYMVGLTCLWIAAFCQPTAAMAVGPVLLVVLIWKSQTNKPEWSKSLVLLLPHLLLSASVWVAGIQSRDWPQPESILSKVHDLSAPIRLLWEVGWSVRWSIFPRPAAGPGIVSSQIGKNNLHRLLVTPQTSVILLIGVFIIVTILTFVVAYIVRSRHSGPRISNSSRNALFAVTICILILVPTLYCPLSKANVHPTRLLGDGETYVITIPLIMGGISIFMLVLNRVFKNESSLALPMLSELTMIGMILFILALVCGKQVDYAINPEHLLTSILHADPTSQSARAQLAEFYLKQNNVAAALSTVQNIPLNQCTSPDAAIAEGEIFQVTDRNGAALACYEKAERLGGATAELLGRIAATHEKLGNVRDIRATYDRAITAFPASSELRNDYGVWLTSQGEYGAAAVQLQGAIDDSPDSLAAHINLANTLIFLQRYSEVAKQLQIAVDLDPDNAITFHNAGAVLASMHDYDNACRMLVVAVALDPDSPEMHNDFAAALGNMGRYRHSVFEFERAIELRPEYPAAKRNLRIINGRAAAAATTRPDATNEERW